MPEPGDYTIGWICAIRTELVAATALLDEKHRDPEHLPANDDNAYVLGRIGRHNVVIAALPQGQYGLANAANVARDLLRSFTNVRIGLMVGIGGGSPSQKHDIRLGDVVVGIPGNSRGGVLQYDYGKVIQGKDFKLTGHLNQPPQCLLTAVTTLGAQYDIDGHDIQEQIDRVLEKKPRLRANYQKPNSKLDCLYMSSFEHAESDGDNCAISCDNSKLVSRLERSLEQDSPMIHYGLIASANQLIKDAKIRDKLSSEEDILCFEMEAAGLMNNFPCLVVRGICDYSDTHKNKIWQGYAAMAAAAFAKDVLRKLAPNKVAAERRLTEILSNVDKKLSVIADSLGKSQRNLEVLHMNRHIGKTIRWLAAPDCSSNFIEALETRHEGSGQRLLKTETYMKWKINPGSILWLNGIPGCGKTILASTIIEDLQSDPECSRRLIYYYFDFTDTQKQTFKSVIRSLMAQLYLKSECTRFALDSLYLSCNNGREQPGSSLLQSTFASMVQKLGKVYIVIDALDECSLRHDILDWMRTLRAEQMSVHLLVTSRPEPDIKHAMDKFHCDRETITISSEMLEDDVRRYVQARVRKHEALSRWQSRPDIQTEIEAVLVGRASGMFRWVACQLDSLEKCCDPKTLRSTLASLPKTLDETYACILARIPPENMRHAIRLLQFLTYSERPLRVDEAVDAIAVDTEIEMPQASRFDPRNRMPIPAEITVYCSSLVVIVRRELRSTISGPYLVEEIQLAHFSVKDYLTSDRLKGEIAQNLEKTSSRSLMAEVCLAYLLELEPQITDIQTKKRFPFSEYCANHWASLAVIGEQNSATVRTLAMKLVQSSTSIELCGQLQTRPWVSGFGGPASGLYFASLLGLSRCVEMLLEQGAADVNAHGGFYGHALQAASVKGHEQIVQLLIEKGADTNARGGRHGNALHAVIAERGSKEIVHILLAEGADLSIPGGKHNNAMEAAFASRRIHIVQLLVEHVNRLQHEGCEKNRFCVSRSVLDQHGPFLLHYAAVYGYVEVIEVLLSMGIECSLVIQAWKLFEAAGREGCIPLAKMLIDRAKWCGGSIWKPDTETVKRLSAAERDVKAGGMLPEDRYGWTPSSPVAYSEHVDRIKSLLGPRTDYIATDSAWMALLKAIADFSEREVIYLILEGRMDITAQDWAGRSIVFNAIQKDYGELFSMLLERALPLVEAKDHYGATVLSMAARFGRLEMVQRLALLPNTDLVSGDNFGRTALWWARIQRSESIANCIIKSAEMRGISLVTPELRVPDAAISSTTWYWWCDVCMMPMVPSSRSYRCKLCFTGDFDICSDCKHLGAHCLVASHGLTLYKPKAKSGLWGE